MWKYNNTIIFIIFRATVNTSRIYISSQRQPTTTTIPTNPIDRRAVFTNRQTTRNHQRLISGSVVYFRWFSFWCPRVICSSMSFQLIANVFWKIHTIRSSWTLWGSLRKVRKCEPRGPWYSGAYSKWHRKTSGAAGSAFGHTVQVFHDSLSVLFEVRSSTERAIINTKLYIFNYVNTCGDQGQWEDSVDVCCQVLTLSTALTYDGISMVLNVLLKPGESNISVRWRTVMSYGHIFIDQFRMINRLNKNDWVGITM